MKHNQAIVADPRGRRAIELSSFRYVCDKFKIISHCAVGGTWQTLTVRFLQYFDILESPVVAEQRQNTISGRFVLFNLNWGAEIEARPFIRFVCG